jgi:hypothetical protein
MIIGLSFGAKKEKSKSTTDVNKTENLVSNQSQATTGFQSGTSATSSTGSQTTTGTTENVTTTNQQQNDRGTQSQSGTTTTLGADVTSALSEAVKSIIGGGINPQNIAMLSDMIAGRSGFDPDAMVAGTMANARTRGEQTLQEQSAARESAIGGTAATNSMAALLAARGRNDLESNLAGVEAQTRAAAEGIANANLAAGVGAQGAITDMAGGLGQTLKGATTTVDMTTLTDQISQLLGQQGATSTVNQNVQTAEQQNTATTQLIQELVNALTNQTATTVGTEKTESKGSKIGGGVSVGI